LDTTKLFLQVAVDDVVKTVHNADVIVFVVPHQFVRGICEQIKGKVKKGAVVLSLIKVNSGFKVRKL
jgi:glycerol-3-phosphate dehydrogenase (NAD+)